MKMKLISTTCTKLILHRSPRGVGNDLKFRRSLLKLFWKDGILPEICAVLKMKFDNRKDATKLMKFYGAYNLRIY